MRVVLSAAASVAAVVLIAVSATFNFLFMASFARSEMEAMMLGAAAVGGDFIKACLPFFIVLAWRQRRLMFTAIGSTVFGFLSIVSLVAALGYAADVRGGTAHSRESLNASLHQVDRDLTRIEAERKGKTAPRPSAVLLEEIARLRQDRLWVSSRECAEATIVASRAYCAGYFALRAELAAAVEGERIEARVRDLLQERGRLRTAGAGQESEPQVKILAYLTGTDATVVRTALILAAAIFVEIGSGLGLYLAQQHSDPYRRDGHSERDLPTTDMPALSADIGEAQLESSITIVERYCVARLRAAPEGSVTIAQVFADHGQWCAQERICALPAVTFGRLFAELAGDLGVGRCGDAFLGIVLANAASTEVAGKAEGSC